MPSVQRSDGAELHFETTGDGPILVLAPYWSGHPTVFAGLLANLARDHQAITWDARGTGASTRAGALRHRDRLRRPRGDPRARRRRRRGDRSRQRLQHRRPRCCAQARSHRHGVRFRGRPILSRGLHRDRGNDRLGQRGHRLLRDVAARLSRGVADRARGDQSADVRGGASRARRSSGLLLPPGGGDDEGPRVGRGRPQGSAAALGDRLWIFSAPAVAGPWLPSLEERRRIVQRAMPEAHLETVAEDAGPVSRPDVVADSIRQAIGVRR